MDIPHKDIFVNDFEEQIETLYTNLITLDKDPTNIEAINEIFRAVHTIKGETSMVGLNELAELAHLVENVLQLLRENPSLTNKKIIDALFSFHTLLQQYDKAIVDDEPLEDIDLQPVKQEFEKLSSELTKPEPEPTQLEEEPKTEKTEETKTEAEGNIFKIEVRIKSSEPAKGLRAYLIYNKASRIGEILNCEPQPQEFDSPLFAGEISIILKTNLSEDELKSHIRASQIARLVITKISEDQAIAIVGAAREAREKEEEKPAPKQKEEKKEEPKPKAEAKEKPEPKPSTHKQPQVITPMKSIRVSVEKLDKLLNIVGELITVTHLFYELNEKLEPEIQDKTILQQSRETLNELTRIASELQDEIMKTRMVPLSELFRRFYKPVRDIASEAGKQVELIIEGEETELDKKMVDELAEPMIHIIRNAIYHGIEPSYERMQMGKYPVGTIKLSATQMANNVVITVEDDGRGINKAKVLEAAIKEGVISPDEAKYLTDSEIINLIFEPGVSTSEGVTDVAGRGMGMSAVKKAIEEMQGSIEVQSEIGKGTKIIIKLPLTLAIVSVILTTVNSRLFAIPINHIMELIKIGPEDIFTVEGRETIYLREREPVSLVRIAEVLKVPSNGTSRMQESTPVVVVSGSERKVGLVVDELIGRRDIVIKPLSKHYQSIEGLSGVSIMGTGELVLVLDVPGVITLAKKKMQRRHSPTSMPSILKRGPVALIDQLIKRGALKALENIRALTGNKEIKLHLEPYEQVSFSRLIADLKKLPSTTIFSLISVTEPIKVKLIFSIAEDQVSKIISKLLGRSEEEKVEHDKITLYAAEIANIVAPGLISPLVDHLGKPVIPSVPKPFRLSEISNYIISSEFENDVILVYRISFMWRTDMAISHLFVAIGRDSLNALIKRGL